MFCRAELIGNLPNAFLPTEAASLGGNPCQTGHNRQRQISDHTVQRVRFLLDHPGTHENPGQGFLLLHQGYLAVGHFLIRFQTPEHLDFSADSLYFRVQFLFLYLFFFNKF